MMSIPIETAHSAPMNGLVRKRENQGQPGRGNKRQRVKKGKPVQEGSHEEVLLADIRDLLARQSLADAKDTSIENGVQTTDTGLVTPFTELEVEVLELSSTGDGLAKASDSDQIYAVPFSVPGDTVRIKVIKHFPQHQYSLADFLSVTKPSPMRDDSRINCRYFASCSGCQFQMMDYADQLKHKKTIVEKAYKNFSDLAPNVVPAVEDTMGSPLQYGYRTKLTPHFDGPPGYRNRSDRKAGVKKAFESVPNIGFQQKGQRKTLDIEDCPIGTEAVRLGMKRERAAVAATLDKYTKGATILLRENTIRIPANDPLPEAEPDTIIHKTETHTDIKTCITDNNAVSTEYVEDYHFTNPAGAFFQNNNSILSPFTQYIRSRILPPSSASNPPVKYLIDAYSGSGLFTITLSDLFTSSTGIDISAASIAFASKNAALNNLSPDRAKFIAADAPELFKAVTYPADETVVVIDPPRKGCDESFLRQLLTFGPRRVVYVSCNVHTQARDVGVLVRGAEEGKGTWYKIESLRGFDFFPQTGHVEGVAVLERIDGTAAGNVIEIEEVEVSHK